MGVLQMKPKSKHDPSDPLFVRARAFTCIATLDSCRTRLVTQTSAAKADWEKQLSDATKAYREIIRDEENHKASQKARAKFFLEVVAGVAERDRIAEAKKEDMKERNKKIAQVDSADVEAKAAGKSGDSAQLALDMDASRVPGMPWATDTTLGVIFTALRDLDESGAVLDDFQRDLMMELAEAEIEGADLGLEASEAIEPDGETEEFESEDDEDTEDEELTF